MFRRSSLALVALTLSLSIAACGGDDDKSDTTEVSESSTTAVVLPAHHVATKDGAQAHSESDVYECSSMDLEGDVGSAAFGGFQDISVRGISCETGRERILDVYDTYDDGSVAADVDGYACDVIANEGDGIVTVRCVTGDDAFRFTAVPAKRKHVELVSECGTFGRYYDVSVRGQGCQAGATFLDSTPTSQLTAIPEGKQVAVGAQDCTTLYVEGDDRTVRCTQGEKALRFSVATKPSTSHPQKYVENPQESSESVETSVKKVKPATKHGLSPVVTISCTSTGPYTAITARGVNCAAVTMLLTQNQTAIEAMERGADPLKLSGGGNFTCSRIDNGGQVETAQCTSPTSGATFRASFAAQSTQPTGNPPATTTPDVGAASASAASGGATSGGAAAQGTSTSSDPDTPTTSPDAATTAPDATE